MPVNTGLSSLSPLSPLKNINPHFLSHSNDALLIA